MIYKKKCRICKKEFTSETRSTRYCDDLKCHQAAYHKNLQLKRRRRFYRRNAELLKAEARSRKQARDYAIVNFDMECSYCGEAFDSWDNIDVHHADCNPFNNDPFNLHPLHKKCHSILQSYTDKIITKNQKEIRKLSAQMAVIQKAIMKGQPCYALKDSFVDLSRLSDKIRDLSVSMVNLDLMPPKKQK